MLQHISTRQPMVAIRYRHNGSIRTYRRTRDRLQAERLVRQLRQGMAGVIIMAWVDSEER